MYLVPSTVYAVDLSKEYPFGGIPTLGIGTQFLVNPVFQLAAVLVILYLVIGAFRYLTSGGDKEAVAKARGMITHAIIGFLLLMAMFLILQFIPGFFGLEGFKIIGP